ncbi:MAG TPA: response regulator [Tepidisphaeraceae bacterium]|jgi:two-component system response regulator FixJ|nr:response regulator [Tepidisphaeraceae bacterium]
MSKEALVHIVDDDPAIRNSLRMVMELASLPALAYASAEEYLEDGRQSLPGCIVLDLRMRGMGGLELLQRLRSEGNPIPVIIISAHADVPTTVSGMKLGAVDVLQKPFEPKALVEAVRRALEKSIELQRQHAENQAIRQRLAALSPRELELLELVVSGKSNKQIAVNMGISIKTVANHRANLMEKTGALNAADLTRISMMAGVRSASAK